MKFYIRRRKKIFGSLRGIVLWPFVFMRPYNENDYLQLEISEANRRSQERNIQLFRHELEHCYQIKRDGVVRFYLKYLFCQIRYGYRENPYEIEAKKNESKELTLEEKEWYARGKIEL